MKMLSTPNHSEHVSTNKGKAQRERTVEDTDGTTQDTSEGQHKGCVLYRASHVNNFLKFHLYFTAFYCIQVRHKD